MIALVRSSFRSFRRPIVPKLSEFHMSEKRVVTKVGPGSVKVVCKSKKTGKVWDYTMCFTDRGCVIATNVGGAECTERYK